MKYKYIYPLCVLCFLFSSCSINGNFKGLYSYYKKSYKQDKNLFVNSDEIKKLCELTNDKKVIIIKGTEIKKCLEKTGKSIVYIWGPICKSKNCYPLSIVQSYCDLKKIDLFIIAEYYDIEQMKVSHNIKKPIFGIDTKYYKTNRTQKYLQKLYQELNINLQKNAPEHRYLLFDNGKYIKSYESIYQVE